MSFTGAIGNQIAPWSIQTLPLHAGLYRAGPYTVPPKRGNNMERNYLNKSMCEKMFEEELSVMEELDDSRKSEARMHKESMRGTSQKIMGHIMEVEKTVTGMEVFCRTKKTCSCHLGMGSRRCCPN